MAKYNFQITVEGNRAERRSKVSSLRQCIERLGTRVEKVYEVERVCEVQNVDAQMPSVQNTSSKTASAGKAGDL